jgi:UDP-N-acetylmuramate dehydrogenase
MEKIFEQLHNTLSAAFPDLELRVDEPMSRHISFRVGGPAALMALPVTVEQAQLCVRTAVSLGVEPFFLGNGSNLLVPDEGVRRFLIKPVPGLNQITLEGRTITAGCGVTLARLAMFARDNSLTGLEFAHGIPGSLGGAVFMNAGAYGGEMAQVVRSVTCLSADGEIETVTDFDFGYRHSVFSDGKRLILSATMELQPGDRTAITERMDELAAQRQSKQPLEFPSAGSMFKRPVGHFAGALIEQSGLKGFTVGGAQVSEKHAGFVINAGGATCSDVLELVRQVQLRVRENFGVELEMEVRVLK